jgi:hypothetical protein
MNTIIGTRTTITAKIAALPYTVLTKLHTIKAAARDSKPMQA